MKVDIIEVGPRDGLQNEAKILTAGKRRDLILKLLDAGVSHIETGAFVSPKWIPQMKDSDKVFLGVKQKLSPKKWKQISMTSLVPNQIGMEKALSCGVKDVAIFAACSESFSQKNINCSIEESFQRFEPVMELARKNKVRVRGYLSTVFGCPYEGEVSLSKVIKVAEQMMALGVYEISFGDTIGVANPKQVDELLKKLLRIFSSKQIAMHFHDTRGQALANILRSLDRGVTRFDSSVGGLGGCPYAKGASGNVASEDVIHMLHAMGMQTGIDLASLVKISQSLEKSLGRALPSKLSKIKL